MSISRAQHVTIALPTLGCKVNRYDSDALARALSARGYCIVPPNQPADVYIVNTCTVTAYADAKSRKIWRRVRKLNPLARLIVTGCYASLAGEQLLAIDGIDAVVPIAEQDSIPDLIAHWLPVSASLAPLGLTASIPRKRATVKVQDGCNLSCAFCAVTLARGAIRSRPLPEVVDELRGLVDAGMREIVLTGVRLDAYGLERGERLTQLLEAIGTLPIARLRLSSLEPVGIDAQLISALAAQPSLCHHFHVCLQSGDDDILRAMRRGYSVDRYRQIISDLRFTMPDATFSTDVIVGFPGETAQAFANTCALLEELNIIQLHIFKYSPRAGTDAATFPAQVNDAVKDARSRDLFALERRLFSRYASCLLGTRVSVLVERAGARGEGLTPQYVRVCAPFSPAGLGSTQTVQITAIGDNYLVGDCSCRQ